MISERQKNASSVQHGMETYRLCLGLQWTYLKTRTHR